MKLKLIKRSDSLAIDYLDDLKGIWLDITRGQTHSYFHSWQWVEHWLKKLPVGVEIFLLKVVLGDSIAVCLLGYDKKKRHHFITSKSYFLHYAGHDQYDSLALEYNQILTRNPNPDLLAALLSALPKGWDELQLPALDNSCFPANCLQKQPPLGHQVFSTRQEPSYYVDLSSVGNGQDGYLRLLSGNSRSNIRRAMKGLSKIGPLKTTQAHDLPMALDIYHELIELHQHSWKGRGQQGAFATEWFRDFHRSIIEKRFNAGEIQLLRITCGDNTVGCLYNFIYQGVVHFYQSGFNYSDFSHFKPGLVCHSLAIPLNADLNHKIYDFLASNVQYKRSLSTHTNHLVWYTIQKPRLRFKLEKLAKVTKRLLKSSWPNPVTVAIEPEEEPQGHRLRPITQVP